MASYKVLDNSIQKILKEFVSLDDQQKKQYNAKLQELFDILETEMKKQDDFKALFRQKQYVGSYFENLKIDEPDEFDVDFELVIPSYIGELKVCASPHPGFCQLKLNPATASTNGNEAVKMKVKKWFDEKGFLLRSKVHQWMQGVVDNALREYRSSATRKTFNISRSYSGPAITLNVESVSQPHMKFSIDLVPVFVFLEWPTTVNKLHKYKKTMGDDKKWYAVPKSKESERDFRLSFWHQEKHLLSGKNQLKPVLKLMKKLRDDQNWKGIASYYLKTLFLWKNDTDYNWSKSMGELFIEMLKDLKEYLLVKKALPFYWVSECNLFSQLKEAQKQSIGGFLQRMVADIERNLDKPDHLLKYFKSSNGNRAKARGKIELDDVTECGDKIKMDDVSECGDKIKMDDVSECGDKIQMDDVNECTMRDKTKMDDVNKSTMRDKTKMDDIYACTMRDKTKMDDVNKSTMRDKTKMDDVYACAMRDKIKMEDVCECAMKDKINMDDVNEYSIREKIKMVDANDCTISDTTKLDDFNEQIIRNTIEQFYTVLKVVPSLQSLLSVLLLKINWKYGRSALRKKIEIYGVHMEKS